MRDILFRARRLDNGDLVSGGSVIHFFDDGEHSLYIPDFGTTCETPYDPETGNLLGFSNCVFYKVDPESVFEYSGKTDRKGNRIFEGDTVEAILASGPYQDMQVGCGKVIFKNGTFGIEDELKEFTPFNSYVNHIYFNILEGDDNA